MRLFIDCDDTLVLWPTAPDGTLGVYLGDKYVPNADLIDAIDVYLRPDVQLVVWSGGGLDYAVMWARKFFEGDLWVALAKDITVPEDGDVVVDDQRLKLRKGVRQYTWQEFVALGIPYG